MHEQGDSFVFACFFAHLLNYTGGHFGCPVKESVWEPVGTHVLPDFLDRVQLRQARRQEGRRDVVWNVPMNDTA
jgi:hypothetical protein